MRFVTTLKTAACLAALCVSPLCSGQGFDAVDGPNVRVMSNEDGSKAVFIRSPDNKTLTKKNFTGNGNMQTMIVYTMDEHGNPRGCKIFDGQNQELYKARYGYRRTDGQLVEEQLFDSRVKRTDKNGSEMPVRRFIYTYNAHGKRSAPIAITLIPGRKAEEVLGGDFKPSALEANPFQENNQRRTVNPSGRPLRR